MKKRRITPSTSVVRKSGILESEVDEDIIALDVVQGQCYGFNSSASAIWRLLETETSVSKICSILETEFSIESRACEADVLRVLNELRDQGLISVSGD